MALTMGIPVKIWDKYHSCCIGNRKFHSALSCETVTFPIEHSEYLSQISLLPMLLHNYTNLTVNF